MILAPVGVRRLGRPELLMALGVAALLVLYASWQVARWGPSADQESIADLFFAPSAPSPSPPPGGLPVEPSARRAWRAPGGCSGSRCCSTWPARSLYVALDLMGLSPYPSPADAFYLAFYPLFLAGLLSFLPPMQSRNERLRFWLDMAVVALGSTAALLYLVTRPDGCRARQGPPRNRVLDCLSGRRHDPGGRPCGGRASRPGLIDAPAAVPACRGPCPLRLRRPDLPVPAVARGLRERRPRRHRLDDRARRLHALGRSPAPGRQGGARGPRQGRDLLDSLRGGHVRVRRGPFAQRHADFFPGL